MTARQFRRGGEDTDIIYTVGDCAVGRCLVAESERGGVRRFTRGRGRSAG
jgi:AraC family transcriptional regulator of adaptative response/methylated-DNA-[protein]-cysteine methyltransferase